MIIHAGVSASCNADTLFTGRAQYLSSRGQTKRSKSRLATFISGDNARALDTMGELSKLKTCTRWSCGKFDKEYTEACGIEGEEKGTQKLFVTEIKFPKENGDRR